MKNTYFCKHNEYIYISQIYIGAKNIGSILLFSERECVGHRKNILVSLVYYIWHLKETFKEVPNRVLNIIPLEFPSLSNYCIW